MEETQHQPRATEDTATSQAGESRGTVATALGPGRLLANPRRVRRA